MGRGRQDSLVKARARPAEGGGGSELIDPRIKHAGLVRALAHTAAPLASVNHFVYPDWMLLLLHSVTVLSGMGAPAWLSADSTGFPSRKCSS